MRGDWHIESEELVLGIARNITELRDAQDELRALNRDLSKTLIVDCDSPGGSGAHRASATACASAARGGWHLR